MPKLIDRIELHKKLSEEEWQYLRNLEIQRQFLMRIRNLNHFRSDYDIEVAKIVKEYDEWLLERVND